MSTNAPPPPIDLSELEQALLAADPPSAWCRRAFSAASSRPIGVWSVWASTCRMSSRMSSAARPCSNWPRFDELGVAPRRSLPDTVVLLVKPDPDKLAALSRDEALVLYWRLLFHARVHVALDERVAEGRLTEAGVRHRIQRIGTTEFDAIRAVLR